MWDIYYLSLCAGQETGTGPGGWRRQFSCCADRITRRSPRTEAGGAHARRPRRTPRSNGATTTGLDGRCGIWIAATTYGGLQQYMYRLQGGHRVRAPMLSVSGDTTQVLGLARRPGTSSAWAAGDMVPTEGGVTKGVLLSY